MSPGDSTGADPVCARVAGRPIPVSALDDRVRILRSGPRGRHLPPESSGASIGIRRWVVRELVTEAVLLHEARVAGIVGPEAAPGEPGPLGTSEGLPAAAVGALVEHVTAAVTVDEADLRDYYERNRHRYHRPEARRVRHVLSADEGTASHVVTGLLAGDDMALAAETGSLDAGSRDQGGMLGEVRRGELTGPLEDAIFGAGMGQILGPIRTEHGWHVARVEAVIADHHVPFEEVRPEIEAELLSAARTDAFGAWLDERSAALAVVEPGYEHPADPTHGVPTHRH